jgi:hypothetical protein
MNGFVCIRSFASQPDAESAQDRLEAEDIHAVVIAEQPADFSPGSPTTANPVRLCVIPDDADRARSALDSAAPD